MSDYIVDSADLTSVANAIRTKGGTSEQLTFPTGFVSAVQAIPTGTTPTGTKQISISANGTTTEDVAAYANAEITVNVPVGYVAADWLNLQKPSGNIVSSVVQSRYGDAHVLAHRKNIGNVFMSQTTIIADSAFYDCYLKKFVGPKVTTVYAAFKTCIYMTHFDILGGSFAASTFGDCTRLATVVLRKTAAVVPLSNVNVFSNTPFASGKAGGTLYVPQALIASYQAATNWSTILGYGSGAQNSIQAIEGSVYETAYADGTPCPQSITNTLTNVISSNTDTSVVAGEAYSATLTADAGYTISSVTVMMKRVDVTSTVYNSSTGVISIAEVNGPIVITATAT